jgi:hypothetical protein
MEMYVPEVRSALSDWLAGKIREKFWDYSAKIRVIVESDHKWLNDSSRERAIKTVRVIRLPLLRSAETFFQASSFQIQSDNQYQQSWNKMAQHIPRSKQVQQMQLDNQGQARLEITYSRTTSVVTLISICAEVT